MKAKPFFFLRLNRHTENMFQGLSGGGNWQGSRCEPSLQPAGHSGGSGTRYKQRREVSGPSDNIPYRLSNRRYRLLRSVISFLLQTLSSKTN